MLACIESLNSTRVRIVVNKCTCAAHCGTLCPDCTDVPQCTQAPNMPVSGVQMPASGVQVLLYLVNVGAVSKSERTHMTVQKSIDAQLMSPAM